MSLEEHPQQNRVGEEIVRCRGKIESSSSGASPDRIPAVIGSLMIKVDEMAGGEMMLFLLFFCPRVETTFALCCLDGVAANHIVDR